MITHLLKQSVSIKRKAINASTRKDELSTIATVNALIQPISNSSQLSNGGDIGKEYILFIEQGTNIRVGDLIVHGSLEYQVASIQERNAIFTDNDFLSVRIHKKDTSSVSTL